MKISYKKLWVMLIERAVSYTHLMKSRRTTHKKMMQGLI